MDDYTSDSYGFDVALYEYLVVLNFILCPQIGCNLVLMKFCFSVLHSTMRQYDVSRRDPVLDLLLHSLFCDMSQFTLTDGVLHLDICDAGMCPLKSGYPAPSLLTSVFRIDLISIVV